MSGNEDNRRRFAAMCDRDLRRRRRPKCGSNAGDDFKIHARPAESFDFLSGTPENHRIPGFQPDNAQARVRESEHQEIDLFLLDLLLAASLSDIVHLCCGRNQLQDLWGYQLVIQDSVRTQEKPQSLHGKQLWIARTRAHEEDLAFHALSPSAMSSAVASPCSAKAASTASRLARECSRSSLRSLSRSLSKISLRVSPSSATHAA